MNRQTLKAINPNLNHFAGSVKIEAVNTGIITNGENAERQFIKGVELLDALKTIPGKALGTYLDKLTGAGLKAEQITFLIRKLNDYFNLSSRPDLVPLKQVLNRLSNHTPGTLTKQKIYLN